MDDFRWPLSPADDDDHDDFGDPRTADLVAGEDYELLDEAEVAVVLASFGQGGVGTVGQVACLLLGMPCDEETGWPREGLPDFQFQVLCNRLARSLQRAKVELPDVGLVQMGRDVTAVVVPAAPAVATGLVWVQHWHAHEFLSFWAGNRVEVHHWLMNSYPTARAPARCARTANA